MSFNMTGVAARGGPLAGGVNRWRAGRKKFATGDTITSTVMTVGASTPRAPAEASAGFLTLAGARQSPPPWQSGLSDCGNGIDGAFVASAQFSGIAGADAFEPFCPAMEPDRGQMSAHASAGPTIIAAARAVANMRRQTPMTLIIARIFSRTIPYSAFHNQT